MQPSALLIDTGKALYHKQTILDSSHEQFCFMGTSTGHDSNLSPHLFSPAPPLPAIHLLNIWLQKGVSATLGPFSHEGLLCGVGFRGPFYLFCCLTCNRERQVS